MVAPAVEELIYSCLLAVPSERRRRLEECCTSHPDLAVALRDRFSRLERMGLLSLDEADSAAKPGRAAALPSSLGPFEIDGVIGRGGMGIVYRGRQPVLGDRPVAVKVLLPDRIADPVSEARFVREGLLAARLQHPNLCPVIDVGKDQGLVYLAMPLIEGQVLSATIDAARALPNGTPIELPANERQASWKCVVRLGERLARALQVAHDHGLVHRDVKPGNIIVRADGEPVLLDFGLARELDDDSAGLTRSLQVLGTPAYMAPEQAEPSARRSDARTDVYSLGATLFECLSRRLPHESASRAELLRHVATEPAARLRRYAPGLPKDLEVVLSTALETSPERRYESARAFADDLARVLRAEPVLARRPSPLYRSGRWIARNRVATALILAISAGLGVSLYLSGEVRAESRDKSVAILAAQSEAAWAEHRRGESLEFALEARALAPESPRTLGLLLQTLGETRESVRFDVQGEFASVLTSRTGHQAALEVGDATQIHSIDDPGAGPLIITGAKPHRLAWTETGDVVAYLENGRVSRRRPDGSLVWETEPLDGTGPEDRTLAPAIDVAGSGADELLAIGTRDGALLALDPATGAESARVPVSDGPVHAIERVPGARAWVVACETRTRHSTVFLVQLAGGIVERLHEGPPKAPIRGLGTSDQGWYCTYAPYPRKLHVGRLDGSPLGHPALEVALATTDKIRDVALDGDRLAFSSGDIVTCFDLADPDDRGVRMPHSGAVSRIAFGTNDESLVTASSDGMVRRWGTRDGVLAHVIAQSPSAELNALRVAETGRIFVLGTDGRLLVLDSPPAPFVRARLRHGYSQLVPVFDTDDSLLVSEVDNGAVLEVDLAKARIVGRIHAEDGMKCRFLAGTTDEPVLWGTKQANELFAPLDPRTGRVLAQVELSPLIASVAIGANAARDGRTVAILRRQQDPQAPLTHVSLLQREASHDSWRLVSEYEQREALADHVCVLGADRVALASVDGGIRITDLSGTRLLWKHPDSNATFVCAAPDGRALVVGFSNGQVARLGVDNGAVEVLGGHTAEAVFTAFSNDRTLAASGDATGELALWDLRTGEPIATWRGHASRVRHLAFAPDDTRLVTSSYDGTIALWPTDPDVVDRVARAHRPRRVAVGSASN